MHDLSVQYVLWVQGWPLESIQTLFLDFCKSGKERKILIVPGDEGIMRNIQKAKDLKAQK